MVSCPEFWPQGHNYWIQILTLPLTGLMILYFPWILEWNNIIASLSQGCFWVSYEGLCGQSLYKHEVLHSTGYHSCQLTLPFPRALMKRYWVPWTSSRLFSLFHYKRPSQVLSDLLSHTSARVLLVKDALGLPPDFRATEKAVCYHANWNLLHSFWTLSRSSLSCPRKDWTLLLQRPGLHGYLILCASMGSTMSLLSLCCSRLGYQFFRCWIAASAAFDLLAVTIVKGRKGKSLSSPRKGPEATQCPTSLWDHLYSNLVYNADIQNQKERLMILLKLDEVIMVHMVAVIICSSSNNIVSFWSLQEVKSSHVCFLWVSD